MNKRLLVVNAGNSGKRFIFEELFRLGYSVTVLNGTKSDSIAPWVRDWIISDTTNHEECLSSVGTYLRKEPMDGIITYWEDDVLLTSRLTDIFGFPWIPFETAKKIRNKLEFRKQCRELDVPNPNHWSTRDYVENKDSLRFPIILKPSYGASSACVKRCNDHGELEESIRFFERKATPEIESALSNGTEMHLEEFITGNEIDVDMVLQNGELKHSSVSDNVNLEWPHFLEKGQSLPSSMNPLLVRDVERQAMEILRKFHIRDGCFNFEAKVLDDGTLVPIEINLRMGWDEVWFFNKEVWDVDLIDLSAKVACGIQIPNETKKEPLKFVSWEYLLPMGKGILSNVEVDMAKIRSAWVTRFELSKSVGDPIGMPPEAYEYLWWYVLQWASQAENRENAEVARNAFHFEITPKSSVETFDCAEKYSEN